MMKSAIGIPWSELDKRMRLANLRCLWVRCNIKEHVQTVDSREEKNLVAQAQLVCVNLLCQRFRVHLPTDFSNFFFLFSFLRKFTFVWKISFFSPHVAGGGSTESTVAGALWERRLENYKNNIWRSFGNVTNTHFFLFELLDRFCGQAEITVFRELWVVTSFVRLWFVSSVFFSPIGCHDFYDDGWLSFSWNLLENNWIRAPIERVFKFKLLYKHGIETPLSLRCKLVKVSSVMTQTQFSSQVHIKQIFCVRLWHFSSQLFFRIRFLLLPHTCQKPANISRQIN